MRRYVKAIVNILLALIAFLAVIFLLPKLLIFFAPFVAGWIIALIAGPFVRFFEEKIKLKRKIGGAFVIVLVIGLVVLLLYMAGSWLVEESYGLISALPGMWAGLESDLNSIGHEISVFVEKLPIDVDFRLDDFFMKLGDSIQGVFTKLGTPTIAAAGSIAKQVPGIFIGVIMALLSSYFFVAERVQINEWFRTHTPVSIQRRFRMVRDNLKKSLGGYIKAQFRIEIWMYLLLVIGLGILQVNYFALIAIGIAFMDFLPFFGTGTIMVPWAIIRFLTEDYKMAIGLLIIWGLGQLIRQVIQPKIVGDSIGVAPIPTLFLLYIGYKLSGVLGMILAVPFGLLVFTMYQEGAFDTVINSISILIAGVNRFRRLNREDMFEVEEEQKRNDEVRK